MEEQEGKGEGRKERRVMTDTDGKRLVGEGNKWRKT